MKKQLPALFIALALGTAAHAQLKVGATGAPAASAMLEVNSGTGTPKKGFLGPQVALTGTGDNTTVTTPATGLMVYNTTPAGSGTTAVTAGYYTWNGTQWVKFNTSAASGNDKNLYEGNGTLTGARTVNMGTNKLTFTGGNTSFLPQNAGSELLIDNGNAGANPRIYSADTLEFQSLANPYQMTLLPSGNVGIGTAAPGAKLEIAGSTGVFGAGIFLNNMATNGRKWSVGSRTDITNGTGTNGTFIIADETTPNPRFVINQSGYVGLGANNPARKLHVVNDIAADGVFSVDNPNTAGFAGGYFLENTATRGWIGHVNSGASLIAPGTMQLGSIASPIAFIANGGERMRIGTNGFVGIGTAAPAGKLHVVTDNSTGGSEDDYVFDTYTPTPTAASNGLFIRGSRGTVASPLPLNNGDLIGQMVFNPRVTAGLGYGGSGVYSYYKGTGADNTTDLRFITTSATRMTIDETGHVGIGTTAPIAALHVEPGAGAVYNFPARYTLNPYSNSTNASGATPATGDVVAGYFGGRLQVNGYIEAQSGALTLSDARAKNVVGRTSTAKDLEVLKAIQVTDYTMRDITLGTKQHKMVIAQELEKVYPQAVETSTTRKAMPTIYTYARSVAAAGDKITFSMGQAHNLKTGDVAVIRFKDKEYMLAVAAADATTFSINAASTDLAARTDLKDAFVYGTEVKDGREVDYNAVAMLNVSATQELAKQLEEAKAEIAALKSERTTATVQMEATQKAYAQLAAQVKEMQQMLGVSIKASGVKVGKN